MSGLAGQDTNYRCLMQDRRWFLKSHPDEFPPYNARCSRAHFPTLLIPKSDPHIIKYLWGDGSWR